MFGAKSSLSNALIRLGIFSNFDAAAVKASDFVGYVSAELIDTPLEKAIMAWKPFPFGDADNVTFVMLKHPG